MNVTFDAMKVIESTGERLTHQQRVQVGVRATAAAIRRDAHNVRHLILTDAGQNLAKRLDASACELEKLGGVDPGERQATCCCDATPAVEISGR